MTQKQFLIGLVAIILSGLGLHLYPLAQSLFYFTMDQGRDAVYVREILTRGKLLLVGPETSISGVYHGVLWFYFIAIGYALFGGSPMGATFMMIVLHQGALAYLMWILSKRISPATSLMVGASMQLFWIFFETSSYAFNPFALVPLALLAILFLIGAWEGSTKKYLLTAAVVGLTFHSHILGAICFLLWYAVVSLFFVVRRKISITHVVSAISIVFLFSTAHLISELTHNFSQWHALLNSFGEKTSFFATTNITTTTNAFIELFAHSVFPYGIIGGFMGGIVITAAYVLARMKEKTTWLDLWIRLSGVLFLISLAFFLPNTSWRSWVTLYLSPIVFISVIGMAASFPRYIAAILVFCIIGSQGYYFVQRYQSISHSDPSMLTNELKAIDWVYQKADGEGFNEYSYLPSVLDYPYQYLFWWHGKRTYGYLPCEYASFPSSPKLFVPGSSSYKTPTKPCGSLMFLIIEPDIHQEVQVAWLNSVQANTKVLETANVGNILVEMREATQNK